MGRWSSRKAVGPHGSQHPRGSWAPASSQLRRPAISLATPRRIGNTSSSVPPEVIVKIQIGDALSLEVLKHGKRFYIQGAPSCSGEDQRDRWVALARRRCSGPIVSASTSTPVSTRTG
jgi:hypothetical protein